MNISVLLEVIFYLLLLALISFLLYFFISFRKAKDEAKRKVIEENFATFVAVLFLWYGPYVIAFIVVVILFDVFGKFFR